MIHRILIPNWHPARLNELLTTHHMKAHRFKKRDKQFVATYAKQQQVPKATGKRRVSLKITLAGRQQVGDDDNWWKSLLDALKIAGLLMDDSPKWLERGGITFARGPEPATEIILEDVE